MLSHCLGLIDTFKQTSQNICNKFRAFQYIHWDLRPDSVVNFSFAQLEWKDKKSVSRLHYIESYTIFEFNCVYVCPELEIGFPVK